MISIFRYEVPVDDRWHSIDLQGGIVHVAARQPDVVEIWAEHCHNWTGKLTRRFRVYGTGQPDVEGTHIGTAIAAGGRLVWHLREMA